MPNALAAIIRRIRTSLYRTGITPAITRLRGHNCILMLHGIDAQEIAADVFEEMVVHLKRHFRLLSLAALVAELDEPSAVTRPAVVLTFDDGLANNATVAYPILERHAVPAAFFVCPGLIDAGSWLWTHEMRARLETLDESARRALATHAPAWSGDAIVQHLKTLSPAARAQGIEAIRAATPSFTPSAKQRQASDLVSWPQLAALDPALVTIGSHSLSHDIMIGMDDAQLEREVVGSKARIEVMLGRPVEYFCYPNGDFDAAADARVRATYAGALSARVGMVPSRSPDRHALPRLAVPYDVSSLALRMALA
ncbi:MAG: polysaccharide deacetylase family protein [Rudaea sp.]|uniref:polysaccharide deacetylase family protein n=1 Tax=Rudaea sp. TaxID=2136325 RepID=UPI0039E70477